MHSLRSIWQVCVHNLVRWICSTRFFVLLLSAFAVYAFVILPLVDLSKAFNEPINAVEPFIALGDHRLLMFVYGGMLMLLFCDVPIMEDSHTSLIIRMSRRTWLGGQILYVTLASLLWTGVILLFTVLVAAPRSYWANEWSYIANVLAYNGGIRTQTQVWAYADASIVSHFTPWPAALHTYMLLSLYGVCIGMLILAINLRHAKSISVIVVLAVNIEAWMALAYPLGNPIRTVLAWISPFHHAWLKLHNFTYKSDFSLAASYVWFFLIIAGLAVIALTSVKRSDLVSDVVRH
jgi:hypothetical protein